jgi:hypothetical protein
MIIARIKRALPAIRNVFGADNVPKKMTHLGTQLKCLVDFRAA